MSEFSTISILEIGSFIGHGNSQPSMKYYDNFRMETGKKSDESVSCPERTLVTRRGNAYGISKYQKMMSSLKIIGPNVFLIDQMCTDKNISLLQESVSYLNTSKLENSHEGFSRTPLTMHKEVAGTEVNAAKLKSNNSIQVAPEVLENTSEAIMSNLNINNCTFMGTNIHRGGLDSNIRIRRKEKNK